MKKNRSKLLALLMALVLALGTLSACGGSDSGNTTPDAPGGTGSSGTSDGTAAPSGDPIKIGVLVADVSGEEALGFRAYYEEYIAANYNVQFNYTEQLTDAASEKSAIERFAAQGCQAIISFSSSDRAMQIETCEANKLYYAVASGMLDDAQYEQYKANEYFVGQVGPSMDTEYEAGYAIVSSSSHTTKRSMMRFTRWGCLLRSTPAARRRTWWRISSKSVLTSGVPYRPATIFRR